MDAPLRSRGSGPSVRLIVALMLVLSCSPAMVTATSGTSSSSGECSAVNRELSALWSKMQTLELKVQYTDIRVQEYNRISAYGTQSSSSQSSSSQSSSSTATTSTQQGIGTDLQNLNTAVAALTNELEGQSAKLRALQFVSNRTQSIVSTLLQGQNRQQGNLNFLISCVRDLARNLNSLSLAVRQLTTMVNGSRSSTSVSQVLTGQRQVIAYVNSLRVQLTSYINRPTSCKEISSGTRRGLSVIWVNYRYRTYVYCDGEWIVIQKRSNGLLDFYRGWDEYKRGFGSKSSDHWLGLEWVRKLTSEGKWQLKIELEDWNRTTAYAVYSDFKLGSSDQNYTLHFNACIAGDAGNALLQNKGMPFSTKDRDHDLTSTNCAISRHGAWWYKFCTHANLNGRYKSTGASGLDGVNWYTWKRTFRSLKSTVMKIRPV